MFANSANAPGCGNFSLHVEWHDCSWHPAIGRRLHQGIRGHKPTKPLPGAAVLPHPVRCQNTARPTMNKIGNRPVEIRNLQSAIRNSTAFTLVELLTVIAIIGILAGMLMTGLPAAVKAAKKAKAKTEIAGIVTAIQAYDQDYSRFPVTTGVGSEQEAAGTNDFTTGLVFGAGINGNNTGYSFNNNSNVMAILMDLQTYPSGAQTADYQHVKNPKQTKYLNAKLSGYNPGLNDPNPPGGVDNNGVYRDPWGTPYVITMDLSFDDQCNDLLYSLQSVSQNPPNSTSQSGFNGLFNSTDANGSGNHFLYHGKVMVWSAGPDKTYDTGPANSGKNKDNVLSWQ
jgi:prepilin-type N-terminal cleavage/methylation domain-containing protein